MGNHQQEDLPYLLQLYTFGSAQGFLLLQRSFSAASSGTGSPRHRCHNNQINKTELRSCGVSGFKVVGAAVPANPRSSSSRTPPPEPLPGSGRRTKPCKTSSGSRFAFDLSTRNCLIWYSLTVTDSPGMRHLVFRQTRSSRPLRGWKGPLAEELDYLTGSAVYYRMDGRRVPVRQSSSGLASS